MFNRLREIFVGQYIGAMLIALFVWQSGVELVTRISRIAFWFVDQHRSVLVPSHYPFPWENLIYSIVSIALYALVAYGLARWLYWKKASAAQENATVTPEQP